MTGRWSKSGIWKSNLYINPCTYACTHVHTYMYAHILKVYASDEGRVQMTAAAFTKGMLDLEGELASILVHLVKRDENATAMLDTSTDSNRALQK